MIHAKLQPKPSGMFPTSAPGWRHDRLHSPSGRRKIGNVLVLVFSREHSCLIRVEPPTDNSSRSVGFAKMGLRLKLLAFTVQLVGDRF